MNRDPSPSISSDDITHLLQQASAGDVQAANTLLPAIYQQLRNLAQHRMSHERPDQTIQATALVHEAYLRLVDQTTPQHFEGRHHFFAAAAEAMRRILIEQARRRSRLKRGGNRRRQQLDELDISCDAAGDDLLALDEALTAFAAVHPRKAELVKLRYFAGLSIEEASEALGISLSSAGRDWAYARAWLYSRITSSGTHA